MLNRLIVRLRPGVRPEAVFGSAAAGARVRPLGRANVHVVDFTGAVSDAVIGRLAARPEVESIEPDRMRHATLDPPDDEKYPAQWALETVHALAAWGMLPGRYLGANTPAAERLKIAVIDSGADCTHPDFRNAGGTSADSEQGGQLLFRLSKALVPTTLAAPACAWQDDYGHGTHVAGTIAAAANNQRGVAGLAYPAQLVIFKVLDSTGHAPDSVIAPAIMDAADAGAAVISMSLGEVGYSQLLQDAINYAWERNVLVVAAAGNDNRDELFFPAAANHVLAVAAIAADGTRASFSNFGFYVRVAAPGVGILSTVPTYETDAGTTDYAYYYGTSMATPHVSAVAGLVAMATPGLAADAIAERIEQSAQAGAEWNGQLGYGIVDAARALGGAFAAMRVGGISGQVVDQTGYPVTGALIQAGSGGIHTLDGGLFRLWNLPAGRQSLHVSAPGFDAQDFAVVVPAGADAPLTVILGAGLGTLAGNVTDQGTAVAGAVVAAASGGLIRATAVTDDAVRYWLNVPAGTYDLRASAVSHQAAALGSQSVSAGETCTNVLAPGRLGRIQGRLMDASGRAVPGASVLVAGEGVSAGAVTDQSGSFSTTGLRTGVYSVSAAADGAEARLSGVRVGIDSLAEISLQLGAESSPAPEPISIRPVLPKR